MNGQRETGHNRKHASIIVLGSLALILVLFGMAYFFVDKGLIETIIQARMNSAVADSSLNSKSRINEANLDPAGKSTSPLTTGAHIPQNSIMGSSKLVENLEVASQDYLKRASEKNEFQELYKKAKKVFGPSGEAAAQWVALGVEFSSDPELGYLLRRYRNEFNANPKPILTEILTHRDEIYADPFLQNMMLNVVMNIQNFEKERSTYLQTLVTRIISLSPNTLNSEISISPASTNIGIGMMLLNSIETSNEVKLKAIESGYRRNKNSPILREKYFERAMTYFPNLRTEITQIHGNVFEQTHQSNNKAKE